MRWISIFQERRGISSAGLPLENVRLGQRTLRQVKLKGDLRDPLLSDDLDLPLDLFEDVC